MATAKSLNKGSIACDSIYIWLEGKSCQPTTYFSFLKLIKPGSFQVLLRPRLPHPVAHILRRLEQCLLRRHQRVAVRRSVTGPPARVVRFPSSCLALGGTTISGRSHFNLSAIVTEQVVDVSCSERKKSKQVIAVGRWMRRKAGIALTSR